MEEILELDAISAIHTIGRQSETDDHDHCTGVHQVKYRPAPGLA